MTKAEAKWTFWCCFIALAAASFGFITRVITPGQWASELALDATQTGRIFGVGLWPFAVAILVTSLIIDKIGYRIVLAFAWLCLILFVFLSFICTGYRTLWMATFFLAIANGAVEAAINPVIATLYKNEKTKWLNIVHAGWPIGLIAGGIIAIFMDDISWKIKFSLVLIPSMIFGFMLLRAKFPVQERVAAGVSYIEMLKQVGIAGCFIVMVIIVFGVGDFMEITGLRNMIFMAALVVGVTVFFGIKVKAFGKIVYIFLLLIMIPLATTELGIDSWITDIMTPLLGSNAGWLIVYTAFIMMTLRFLAGPIVHKLSPLGLLATCSAIAAISLFALYKAEIFIWIAVAATFYGIGKAFFWPTMMGIVAERFPKGGALAINGIGAMGMLSVGLIGNVFLGNIQDNEFEKGILAYDNNNNTAIHQNYMNEQRNSVFGKYQPLDRNLYEEKKEEVIHTVEKDGETEEITLETIVQNQEAKAKKNALKTASSFPAIMFICFLILIFYFKSIGGYKPEKLAIKKE